MGAIEFLFWKREKSFRSLFLILATIFIAEVWSTIFANEEEDEIVDDLEIWTHMFYDE